MKVRGVVSARPCMVTASRDAAGTQKSCTSQNELPITSPENSASASRKTRAGPRRYLPIQNTASALRLHTQVPSSIQPAGCRTKPVQRAAGHRGPVTMLIAHFLASSINLSAGTSRFTMPSSSAVFASNMSPLYSNSAAFACPTSCGKKYVPPKSGNNPTFANVSPKFAVSEAITAYPRPAQCSSPRLLPRRSPRR